jgi:hypothetical protein
MSKTNDTSKLGHATLENRVLADSELDAVSGGFFADYVKQLLANSEAGFGKMSDARKGGAIIVHDYGFWWRKSMSKTNDTAKLDHTALEDNHPLADSELDAVTGGRLLEAASKGKVFKTVEIHGT